MDSMLASPNAMSCPLEIRITHSFTKCEELLAFNYHAGYFFTTTAPSPFLVLPPCPILH
jgi:hypothetical protein